MPRMNNDPLPASGGDADPPSRGAAPTKLPAALQELVTALSSSRSCISLINPLLLLRPLASSLCITVSPWSWRGIDTVSYLPPLKEAEA